MAALPGPHRAGSADCSACPDLTLLRCLGRLCVIFAIASVRLSLQLWLRLQGPICLVGLSSLGPRPHEGTLSAGARSWSLGLAGAVGQGQRPLAHPRLLDDRLLAPGRVAAATNAAKARAAAVADDGAVDLLVLRDVHRLHLLHDVDLVGTHLRRHEGRIHLLAHFLLDGVNVILVCLCGHSLLQGPHAGHHDDAVRLLLQATIKAFHPLLNIIEIGLLLQSLVQVVQASVYGCVVGLLLHTPIYCIQPFHDIDGVDLLLQALVQALQAFLDVGRLRLAVQALLEDTKLLVHGDALRLQAQPLLDVLELLVDINAVHFPLHDLVHHADLGVHIPSIGLVLQSLLDSTEALVHLAGVGLLLKPDVDVDDLLVDIHRISLLVGDEQKPLVNGLQPFVHLNGLSLPLHLPV
mmetsp:Transcript_43202/g.137397  ORF Transcript_43202/g.137397 Transcript_43202/m.137397 type:complete len:408 (-) Transcript_43202:385-1608(-)